LAWQVMGTGGPISNPRGIRYLPQSESTLSSLVPSPLLQIGTALAGVNILLSTGTLVLAAETLAAVRRLSEQVDVLLTAQDIANVKLDQVIEKLTKLESKVSEGRLAMLVDHAVRASARGSDEISFLPFAELAQDLDVFILDAEITRGSPATLRLGSDVRGALRRICQLLRGVRLYTAHAHNQTCDSAELAWSCHPNKDYWSDVELRTALMADIALREQGRTLGVTARHAHSAIDKCFTLNVVSDHVALQKALNEGQVATLIRAGIDDSKARAILAGVHDRFGDLEKRSKNPFLDEHFLEEYSTAILAAMRQSTAQSRKVTSLPPQLIDLALEDAANTDEVLSDWRSWWLHRTDAGLVYRTFRECLAIQDGYVKVFSETPAVFQLPEGHVECALEAPGIGDLHARGAAKSGTQIS
jgi:hypothetical protein